MVTLLQPWLISPEQHMSITNREKVSLLRQKDPSMPAVRIAEALNISRERVRQLLNEAGLPTYFRKYYGSCELCGGDIPSSRKAYCSNECRTQAKRITFQCDYCGQDKILIRAAYNAQKRRGYKHMYCSIKCRNWGKWALRNATD
jgi:RNA polymerase-binding transcription factor DksA